MLSDDEQDTLAQAKAKIALQDESEALTFITQDPLMRPDQWPLLERPRNARELGEVVLAVSQTRAGRLLINELVVGFLLAFASDITAERHQGQADVVRYLLQHLGPRLSRGVPQGADSAYFNPWRKET